MESIFNLLVKIMVLTISSFIVYSVYTLVRYKGITSDVRVPQPYRMIYNRAREIPFLGKSVNGYVSDLSLIYNSDSFARISVAVLITLLPSVDALLIMIVFYLVKTWYFALLISIAISIIPFLSITNYIMARSRNIRFRAINLYEAAERHFSRGLQVSEAFGEIAASSPHGPLGRLSNNFLDKYILDPEEAYSYLSSSIGDKYSEDFSRTIQKYDDQGGDPCPAIMQLTHLATRHYRLQFKVGRNLVEFKKAAVTLFGICLICMPLAESLAQSMGGHAQLPQLSYICLTIILFVYIAALYYERT